VRQVTIAPTFPGWQRAARRLLAEDIPPPELAWEELEGEQPSLGIFEEENDAPRPSRSAPFRVPKAFLSMAERVACHRDPRRWALLYAILWRLTHGEPKLLEIVVDPDIHELLRLDGSVRHDLHRMRAFVRFRQVQHAGETWYVAWFEPEHYIVERNAAFFVDRFAGMRWSILTPGRCVHWDGQQLSFTAGVPKSEAPGADTIEDLWRTYYGHIFNPARVKTKALQSEMPKRYWKNLPEAEIIPALLKEAPARVGKMMAASEARAVREADYAIATPPPMAGWEQLRDAACACRACPLWRNATQTVFGEGPRRAELMLLGEQPGDAEDLAGRPFVGPAGQLLDRALAESGIEREQVYVTNVVKHFKWDPRGKRRLHQTPNSRDIAACRPWFEAELRVVQPRILLCLGSTAATAVFGPSARVLRDRGEVRASPFVEQTLITFHPSALLRAPDEAARAATDALFVLDLRIAAGLLGRRA
jgi:probable DNA metabolism protein